MPDPRFHTRTAPKSLADIAALCGGTLVGGADPALQITDVAPLDSAGAGELAFLDNPKYKDSFAATKAAACIVAPALAPLAPAGVALVLSDTPYRAYALVAQAFYPAALPAPAIAASASVAPDAVIGDGCTIEHGAVIGAGAEIGAGTWIGANSVIGAGVVIGPRCRIGALVTISHALIGAGATLYTGVRIGQDGFGFAIDPRGFVKVPQLGRVVIGDNVEIGANTTIDRGAGPDTEIGAGTWIDNLVQIGHNVRIGRGCILIAQSGVAGSTVMEDYSVLAAQGGIAGHLKIGKGARIGAQSGVMRDVPAGAEYLGSPAQPVRDYMRQVGALKRLTKPQKSE